MAATVCRQGLKERVDRHVAAAIRPGQGLKDAAGNSQIEFRRNHVNMIGLSPGFAFHLRDRHPAFFGKQLRQMALVLRIEVLNQHECHARIVRQMAEQFRECFQSAGRGADTDNHRQCAVFVVSSAGWPLDRALKTQGLEDARPHLAHRLTDFFVTRHPRLSRRNDAPPLERPTIFPARAAPFFVLSQPTD